MQSMVQQHGVTKRKNKTVVETARVILEEKHMPKNVQVEAIKTTVYLLNHTSTRGANITPHDAYFKCKHNMANLRVFDKIAYVHVLNDKRKKLNPKTEKCILVRYSHKQNGYKYYNPRSREVQLSRDIILNESTSGYSPLMVITPVSSEPNSEDDVSISGSFEINPEIQDYLTSLWRSRPESEEESGVMSLKMSVCRNKGKKKKSQYGH